MNSKIPALIFCLPCRVQVFDAGAKPITVRRSDMVRSALTQIAERSVDDLLLGITALHFPGLQDTELTSLLGLRVQFVGEEAVDMGGVRGEAQVSRKVMWVADWNRTWMNVGNSSDSRYTLFNDNP